MEARLAQEGPEELASGVDALYLSAWAQRPECIAERLFNAKHEAEQANAPVPFRFGGQDFELQPKSWRAYTYLLTFEGGRIGVNLAGRVPPFRLQPHAPWLHALGAQGVAAWFRHLLEEHLMFVDVFVSRIDLYADFEGLALTQTDLDRFVGRARARQHFEEAGRWTGFVFGKRKSGTICARIYDKTEQLRVHRSGIWEAIWGRPIEGPPVTRVEFELTGTALREFGLRTPDEVLAAVGSVWAWVTEQWLTLRVPGDDETKSRWPVDNVWRSVQRARIADEAVGIERVRAAATRAGLRFYAPRCLGALASVAALLDTEDLATTLKQIPLLARGIEAESGRSFEERVEEKRRRA